MQILENLACTCILVSVRFRNSVVNVMIKYLRVMVAQTNYDSLEQGNRLHDWYQWTTNELGQQGPSALKLGAFLPAGHLRVAAYDRIEGQLSVHDLPVSLDTGNIIVNLSRLRYIYSLDNEGDYIRGWTTGISRPLFSYPRQRNLKDYYIICFK